ncbi:thiamine phosphate synthase [Heliobacterium chlorum]|uniref:Thiamine-phosphate synthase n=1 Tax=Heliobacterium chlorum TaxID=2698 RepID=A0ABR7T5A4_HELCL|nr:thiamine phosphate synthase [Heliobacterium chlorum]MBC9784841.1 thiamine phosphate synthase [Heliobacterium chlorum]
MALFVVTNRHLCQTDIVHVLSAAVEGGVHAVILREKDLLSSELLPLARQVKNNTSTAHVPLIINGNIAVALAVEADGIHLTESDLAPSEVRKIAGPAMLLGRSVHSLAEVEQLIMTEEIAHLNYLLFGNVYETECKPGKPAQGIERLGEIVQRSPLPVIAIGGIRPDRIEKVLRSGAAGVAVMTSMMRSKDPRNTAKDLVSSLQENKSVEKEKSLFRRRVRLWKHAEKPLLYGIIGSSQAPDDISLCTKVREALEGGCDILQLREKNISTGEFLHRARLVRSLTAEYGKILIINDRVDIAMACGADGVHVGQEDMPAREVRRIWPQGILGVTVRNKEQAKAAEQAGADYVGAGPVFPTTSKSLDVPSLGFLGLQQICQTIELPVVAIGGLDAKRIQGISQTGCRAVAMISAIFNEDDPKKAAHSLKQNL